MGLFALGRDITDRQRTEAALQQSETLLKGIFEASVDAIMVTDCEGVIVDCNPAAAAMGDLSVEEVVGRSLFDFVAPGSRDTIAASMAGPARG